MNWIKITYNLDLAIERFAHCTANANIFEYIEINGLRHEVSEYYDEETDKYSFINAFPEGDTVVVYHMNTNNIEERDRVIQIYANPYVTSIECGKGITKWEGTWNGCNKLKLITIPKWFTKISLPFIISESLETICYNAPNAAGCQQAPGLAYNCPNLKKIVIDNKVKTMPCCGNYGAACETPIEVNVPNSVESFSSGCFYGLLGLKKINIPRKIKELPSWCFFNCGVQELLIPSTVKIIRDSAILKMPNLEKITLKNGVLKIERAFCLECPKLDELVVPKSVKEVDSAVFFTGRALFKKLIWKPTEFLFNGNYFLYDAPNLQEFVTHTKEFPTSILHAAGNVPTNLKKISYIGVDVANLYFDADSVLEVYIDAKIIKERLFANKKTIKKVVLKHTEKIEYGAFVSCNFILTELPNSLTYIGDVAFNDCNLALKKLPNKLRHLGGSALISTVFDTETLIIPETLSEISGPLSSELLPKLKRVINKAQLVSNSMPVFIGACPNLTYYESWGWNSPARTYGSTGIPLNTYIIHDGTIYSSLGSVIKSKTDVVIRIKDNAVLTNLSLSSLETKLVKLYIDNDITEIPKECFYNCSKLTDVISKQPIISVGASSFYNCIHLKNINTDLSYIGRQAFYNCCKLRQIKLNTNLTDIPYRSFYNCVFENIKIPKNVKSVDCVAFYLSNIEKFVLKCDLDDFDLQDVSITKLYVDGTIQKLSVDYTGVLDCAVHCVYLTQITPPVLTTAEIGTAYVYDPDTYKSATNWNKLNVQKR